MKKSILLVDDDLRFRNAVMQVLLARNYSVMQATSVKEAQLELGAKFDLLIIDGLLPDGDGIELIRTIRETNADVPIVFVSAVWRDTKTYLTLTKGLKVRLIVHKPVIPVAFGEQVAEILGTAVLPALTRSSMQRDANDKLARLSATFAKELPSIIDEIAESAEQVKLSLYDLRPLTELSCKVHKLRGSAGSYGFHNIGSSMGIIEDTLTLMINKQITADRIETSWHQVEQSILEAEQEAKKVVSQSSYELTAPESSALEQNTLIVLSQDPTIVALLQPLVASGKAAITVCETEEAVVSRAEKSLADMVIIDETDSDSLSSLRLAKNLHDLTDYESVPLVVITASKQNESPARHLYSGFSAVLQRPLSPELLAETMDRLVAVSHSARPKVVAIDDDRNITRRIEAVLSLEGFEVFSFTDTAAFTEIISEIKPDMLLLDIEMPGVSGFDLCRRLRENRETADIPVIYVTAKTGWEMRLAAFESGGDDYLAKPIINAELVMKINFWVQRSRLTRRAENFDGKTGLLGHTAFTQKARALLSDTRSAVAAWITLDNLTELNEKHRVESGDVLLSLVGSKLTRRFRQMDIRGRWSGATFALYLPETELADAERAISYLITELESMDVPVPEGCPPFHLKCSARLAAIKPDRSLYSQYKASEKLNVALPAL